MLELNSKVDILDLSVRIHATDKGLSTAFRGGVNGSIKDILTRDEFEKVGSNIKEISTIINDAIIREIEKDLLEESPLDGLSFIDFMKAIDEDEGLKDALDNVMKFFDKAKNRNN